MSRLWLERKPLAIIARKISYTRKGKRYGPYPKESDLFYLYEVKRVDGKVVTKYLGKGAKPTEVI